MFNANKLTSLGNQCIMPLFGYIVAPRQWRVLTHERLGRFCAKALEGYHAGLVTMMEAVATLFEHQHDGLQVIPGTYPQIDNQHTSEQHQVVDNEDLEGTIVEYTNMAASGTIPSAAQVRSDSKSNRGFIPRPLQLGSTYGPARAGIRARPLSFQSGLNIESAQKALEKKKKRNSVGSVPMGEWLAQLHAGSNPYVDRQVIRSVAGMIQDTEPISSPVSPATPSLTSTSSSTSPTSTPPPTPPTSPLPISPKKAPEDVFDILSAFPLPPSTNQWTRAPVSLPGCLDTIPEEVPVACGDRRRRARCSYNGGKFDIFVAPIVPQELLTEEIGVAC